MIKIKAYYQAIHEFDLNGIDVTEEENGIPVLTFHDEFQFGIFMNRNNLGVQTLAEGTVVAVTKGDEPSIYGKVVVIMKD